MANNIQINLKSISKNAKEIFHRLRWKGHIYCPQCGSIRIATDTQSHRCKDCDFRFSDTSNTVFHSTKLPLSKWLYAIYLFCTQSRGISSYNLALYYSYSTNKSHVLTYNIDGYNNIGFRLGISFWYNKITTIKSIPQGCSFFITNLQHFSHQAFFTSIYLKNKLITLYLSNNQLKIKRLYLDIPNIFLNFSVTTMIRKWKSYITQYLNEFAWRWTHFDDKLENKIESLFGFLVWFFWLSLYF